MYNVLHFVSRYRSGHFTALAGLLLFSVLTTGCDSGTAPSIYDPDQTSLPDPVIGFVTPLERALAGVDEVIITGSHFSTTPEENLVYFGTTRAVVSQSSATELRMIAPNDPQPEIQVRISVTGAENFSNQFTYRLDPPFIEFAEVQDFEDVFGIATDPSGNVYVSMAAFSIPVGIIRVTPDGQRSDFITSAFLWNDLEFDSKNNLYGVRSVRAVFRAEEGTNDFAVFSVIPDNQVRLTSIALDALDRIWVAGANREIYRIMPDGSIMSYAFEANIRDLVVYDDHLYVVALQNDLTKVWRFPIDSGGDLGIAEEYFDLTSFNGTEGYALAFTSTGELYIGTTSGVDPIIVVSSERSGKILYPSVLTQPARNFAWGDDGFLYTATSSSGTDVAGIIRVTTRHLGLR